MWVNSAINGEDLALNVQVENTQVEKSFLQNKRGYRDGSEFQKGKKQGVVTQ